MSIPSGLSIILEGDGAFKDVEHLEDGALDRLALLQMGTTGGRPAVAFLVKAADGRHVMGQTTLLLLEAAVRAMVARTEMIDPNWRDGGAAGEPI